MAPLDALMDTAPDIVHFAVGFAYGEVLSRADLDLHTRQLCTVAALTALGHATLQLEWHRQAALRVGANTAELDEVTRIALDAVGQSVASPAAPGGALDERRRWLVQVALLTAVRNQPDALGRLVAEAARAGVARQEIVGAMEQMAVYAGFPAALNGLGIARRVFAGL
jgi:4-carboxymuconolactone decarboxylase